MLGGGCQVRVVRVSIPCYLPPHNSFLLFRTRHLLRPTHQENTWQTYLKTAATAHAQTCQNMSGYDLSNISMKQKSNMSVDLLKQGQKFLRQQRRMLKSQMHCSASLEAFSAPNMPNHVRIPPVNISVG